MTTDKSSNKRLTFNVLGFTAATGEPIMCAIIFAAKDLDPAWVLGMDPFVPWIGKPDDIEGSTGAGKVHLVGPECNFHEKNTYLLLLH